MYIRGHLHKFRLNRITSDKCKMTFYLIHVSDSLYIPVLTLSQTKLNCIFTV